MRLVKHLGFISALILALSSCTRATDDNARINIQLPVAVAAPYSSQKVSAFTVGPTKWHLADPGLSNQLNCFVVAVTAPEFDKPERNDLISLSGNILMRPQFIAGGFPAGSVQEIEVPSGLQRKIMLIGFKTDDINECVNFKDRKFSAIHFSAPFMMGVAVQDLVPGANDVVITYPSALGANAKFEECVPFMFSFDQPPPGPTATFVAKPNSIDKVTTLAINIGGADVVNYRYAIVAGSGCAGATYGAAIAETSNITDNINGLADGNVTVCVKGIDANSVEQVIPSSYTWIKDTVIPTTPTLIEDRTTATSLYYSPLYSWVPSTDINGIDHYEIAIGTGGVGSNDVFAWNPVFYFNKFFTYATGVFSMTDNSNYTFSVRALDHAGNVSLVSGDNFATDLTAPWIQQSFIKAENCETNDVDGASVSIDGDLMAVGAPGESNGTGGILNGTGITDTNALPNSGAVYVYRRTGGNWAPEAYIKASSPAGTDNFGAKVSLHSDVLVVGAPGRAGGGAVYVFRRSAGTWSEEAILTAPNGAVNDYFGGSVGVYKNTIVVGSQNEDGNTPGPSNVAPVNAGAASSGAAYVYEWSGTGWNFSQYLKAPVIHANDLFGSAVSIYMDTIVVTATGESSSSTTIVNGQSADTSTAAGNAGAAYVFVRNGANWQQQAYIKAANADSGDSFGYSVSVFEDTIAVGATSEGSNQTTITNAATASANNTLAASGAV